MRKIGAGRTANSRSSGRKMTASSTSHTECLTTPIRTAITCCWSRNAGKGIVLSIHDASAGLSRRLVEVAARPGASPYDRIGSKRYASSSGTAFAPGRGSVPSRRVNRPIVGSARDVGLAAPAPNDPSNDRERPHQAASGSRAPAVRTGVFTPSRNTVGGLLAVPPPSPQARNVSVAVPPVSMAAVGVNDRLTLFQSTFLIDGVVIIGESSSILLRQVFDHGAMHGLVTGQFVPIPPWPRNTFHCSVVAPVKVVC